MVTSAPRRPMSSTRFSPNAMGYLLHGLDDDDGLRSGRGPGHSPEPPSVHLLLASLSLRFVAPGVERRRFFEDGADGTAIEAELLKQVRAGLRLGVEIEHRQGLLCRVPRLASGRGSPSPSPLPGVRPARSTAPARRTETEGQEDRRTASSRSQDSRGDRPPRFASAPPRRSSAAERLHVDRRVQPHIVVELHNLSAPMVSARGLHRHHAARLRGEEVRQPLPAHLPAERDRTVHPSTVKLKGASPAMPMMLTSSMDASSFRGSKHDPPWHTAMPSGGGVHSINIPRRKRRIPRRRRRSGR